MEPKMYTCSKELWPSQVDHSHVMSDARYEALWVNKKLSDVCLIVNGRRFLCHRLVLSVASDVFQAMMYNEPWSESRQYEINLEELDICLPVFESFLRYFYTGCLTLTIDTITPMLMLADKYMIKDLIHECLEYMSTHMGPAASVGLLIQWQQQVTLSGHSNINKKFRDFLLWNIILITNDCLASIDVNSLCSILKETELVAVNEFQLYKLAVKWLELNRVADKQTMKRLVKQVMAHIRFPMMSPWQLAELSLCSIANENSEYTINRMALGMAYHSGNDQELKMFLQDPANKNQLVPRIYTDNERATLLTVEGVHSLPLYHRTQLVFVSQTNRTDSEGSRYCEWSVSLYPKGVCIDQCILINHRGTLSIPQFVKRTVRLSVTCIRPIPASKNLNLEVKISVLVYGMQDGVEAVCAVKQGIHTFSETGQVFHMDDLIPYDQFCKHLMTESPENPAYTIGPESVLKLRVVIEPRITTQ